MKLATLFCVIILAACNCTNGDEMSIVFPEDRVRQSSTWTPKRSNDGNGDHVACAIPGVDYPNYKSAPKTNFTCADMEYIPGFYADMETGCQVARICTENHTASLLCPTNTIFNQSSLLCDTWFKTNCSESAMYYKANEIFLTSDDFGPTSYTASFPDEIKDFMIRVRKFTLVALLEKVATVKHEDSV